MKLKKCYDCKFLKKTEEFSKNKTRSDGLNNRCKQCHNKWYQENKRNILAKQKVRYKNPSYRKEKLLKDRDAMYRKKYGFKNGYSDKLLMIKKQKGICLFCKNDLPKNIKRCHVDHNHDTGQVRGVICSTCNQLIGIIGEDLPSIVNTIININDYLVKKDKLYINFKEDFYFIMESLR